MPGPEIVSAVVGLIIVAYLMGAGIGEVVSYFERL